MKKLWLGLWIVAGLLFSLGLPLAVFGATGITAPSFNPIAGTVTNLTLRGQTAAESIVATNLTGSISNATLVGTTIVHTIKGNGRFLTNLYAQTDYDMPRSSLENITLAAIHRKEYEDSTNFVETWATNTAWGISGVFVTNKVYGSGANPAGANRAFPVGTNENMRLIANFQLNAPSTGSGYIMAGFSTNNLGQAPAAGGYKSCGIGFSLSATNWTPLMWNAGVISNPPLVMASGDYQATIILDKTNISFSLMATNSATNYYFKMSRSYYPYVSNIFLWNADSRGGAGATIGAIAAKKSTATIAPRTSIEDVTDTMFLGVDGAGQNIRIWVPKNYDSRVPAPVLLFCHGHGWDENFTWGPFGTNGAERTFFQTIVNNGFIVASSFLSGNNWGNQAGIDGLTSLYDFVRKHYAINGVYVCGASMGGLTSLNWIAQHKAEVSGYVGLYPVCSLKDMYLQGTYAATIRTAFGIAGDGSDYDQKTAGYDPVLTSENKFYRIPMRFYVSFSDTTVNTYSNACIITNRLAGYSIENSLYVGSGAHGDASCYPTNDVIQFLNRCGKYK